MKSLGYIVFLLIIIFGISFAITNSTPVAIHYYVGVTKLPLSLLLVVSFGIGLIVGFSVLLITSIKLRTHLGRTKRKLRVAEQEIDNLRTIPIKDSH
jgi:putative membrane protein